MKKVMFVPGFACTPEIWVQAPSFLPDLDPLFVQWDPAYQSIPETRAFLAKKIHDMQPDVYVGHSLGGLLLLELLLSQEIPSRRTIVVDAFLQDPHDMFKNFVWENDTLNTYVTDFLAKQRSHFSALKESMMDWKRLGWPDAALKTKAHFVYGGRGATTQELIQALEWPSHLVVEECITVIPKTSHFLMLEKPEAFYQAIQKIINRT